ncbi:hypothetical protein BTHERMOSOX_1198 [Bathymodiolus thermophilus thioautotrophic gill symbiont]|uniref:hypothetical protein n=1 Tax=Bathymodiolus thermophilus thioautotrophic gill symbiont TaxID=2360 RepID=UPI0010BB0520|nr:hypothetical protein [Bathymodiolus thermophilus thioautotrophic gill symbiont]SHA21608.1 hypothetical protein BTHERMOSOX_1198 [Bathymodiolus thermophilus thioautotrophic gill symbiont]
MQTQINIRHNTQKIHTSGAYLKDTRDNTNALISNTINTNSGIRHNLKATPTTSTSDTPYISTGTCSNNYTLIATVTSSNANITPNPSGNCLYDANGNTTQNNKLIQWISFNKPKCFTKASSNNATTFAPLIEADTKKTQTQTQTKANSNATVTTTYINFGIKTPGEFFRTLGY